MTSEFNAIKEGKATVLVPKEEKVFYNHIQQFNRDLSVMAIQAWAKTYSVGRKRRKLDSGASKKLQDSIATQENLVSFSDQPPADLAGIADLDTIADPAHPAKLSSLEFIRILEALSASGLRALRYGHEISQVSRVVANDLSPDAVASINRLAQYNGLDHIVKGHQGDAVRYMGSVPDKDRFHVVDLDPYGTAAPFLENAILALQDHGILMVTCTDAGVLAGNGYPEKCFALYGGSNFGNTFMRLEANHEAGLRLMLATIAQTAARHKRTVEPLLSLSIDYYFRVFVRVSTSPAQVKNLAASTMLVYHCVGCGHAVEQRMGRVAASGNRHQTPRMSCITADHCHICGGVHHVAGPMWGGPLHSKDFIDAVLEVNDEALPEIYATRDRITGMLTLARHELETPFYISLGQLPSLLKTSTIPISAFANALGSLGHRTSLTHAKPNSIKTDAPWEDVLLVLARWLRRANEARARQLESQLSAPDITSLAPEKKTAKETALSRLSADIDRSPNLSDGMVGTRVLNFLAKDSRNVDFDTVNEFSAPLLALRKLNIVRFQETPPNWGPKGRPGK